MNYKALVLLATIFLSSCISGKKSLRDSQGTYLENVKLNFEAGEGALKNEEFDKAVTYFQFVKSKYPFSKYAALSDLRIADTRFAQKKWLDAASAYEVFIRLHPRHEEVDYASFKVGSSYFNAVPTDFFLRPPATTRDPSFAKEALSAIERFILQYPESEHIPEAKKQQDSLFSFLAKHHQHVANYYFKRKKYDAAIDRYLLVEKYYPESKEAADSLFLAAEIYRKNLQDDEKALEIFNKLIESKKDYPGLDKAIKIRDSLLD